LSAACSNVAPDSLKASPSKQYGLKRLVYFEQFATIQDAIQREHNIKHWSRAWKVRLIVADDPEWDDLYETIAK
jgi:putative endonuclease